MCKRCLFLVAIVIVGLAFTPIVASSAAALL